MLKVDRQGPTGNIFYVMGKAHMILDAQGRHADAERMIQMIEAQARDYEEALMIISEFIELEY